MALNETRIKELEIIAKKLRYNIIRMIGPGVPGHVGGSCSLAEILAVLYFHKMKHDPANPGMPDRDRLILSKGHAAIAQYSSLAECGYFPLQELSTLKQLGSRLQGHPDMLKVPGIEANTGSLGQGLSISCGIALAGRLDKLSYRVYCIVGDGEMAEGQIWEAAMGAANFKLDNLTVIVDKNRIQATGLITERFDTNPHREKWLSYNWHVIETDGHSIADVESALSEAEKVKNKPSVIIAHTVKGKGISFAENTAAFHNGIMTGEQYETALEELR
ncbi:MAG: transketolase [Bacteroidales bacterium]|jgi:transketolase|nr:transketolase [Bacteroidales bacterium]